MLPLLRIGCTLFDFILLLVLHGPGPALRTLTASSPWFFLVTLWLYYLAATVEDNWNGANNNWITAKQITYIWTRAN